MEKIAQTEKGLNFIEKALAIVEKYKIKTILKAVLVVLIAAATIGFIKNPTFVFEWYEEWKEKQHQEQMDLRNANNEKIQRLLDKSLYKIEADRITVLELHNGTESIGGLPFTKCSATFEVMDDGVIPIAHQYQDQQLSLIPFANYLNANGYFCGDLDALEAIDRGLYHRMASNGTTHFAACLIEGVDKPLAFLFVSFNGPLSEEHNCDMVREQIRHIALEVALCLELNKR
jgi:hypothetical protein